MQPLALLAAMVFAQADPGPVHANGYFSERLGGTAGWSSGDASQPALAQLYGTPALYSLTEANTQLRVKIHDGYDLLADLSFFLSAQSASSGALGLAASEQNEIEPSELYLNLGFHEHLNGLLGRKRLVWGSGFAWNPTDLLNPVKDPTDPTLQRAGAWMARVEAPFESFTLTALWAPGILRTQAGLPSRLLFEPGSHEAEQLFAARAYALLLKADVNLMWFWSNRYADALPHSHRFGASFSRYFFTDYELHAEALLQRGRDLPLVDPACEPFPALAACAAQQRPVVSSALTDPDSYYVKLIAGTRYTFADESLLSLEYFFNGTGMDAAQFAARQALLDQLPTILALAPQTSLPDLSGASPASAAGAGAPVRFEFQTLRRHYLFLVYQKPRIADDFTATATAIVGLEGPSALFAPSLSWSAREWLNLALYCYLPVGARTSEFGSLPLRFRALFEARVFY